MPRAARSLVFALLSLLPAPALASEGGAASVVPVAELRVPILDAGRFAGTLRVQSALDYADPAESKSATERAPELRAAALAAGLEFARLHVSALTPIDAALLSQALTRAARSIDPHVRRVLILDVSARQP